MSSNTDEHLTSGQRLARGVKYSVVGPLDVIRATFALALSSAMSSAAWAGRQCRRCTSDTEGGRCRRRPLLLLAIVAIVLAGGAAAFSMVRRSKRPEPSALPPSVEVTPKP